MIVLKSQHEIDRMRTPCQAVAQVLNLLRTSIEPGITTSALNAIAEREAGRLGAKPAFKGYSGYPYSLCCSVNSEVVHGMPSNRELMDGDIISVDFGLVINGYYGDSAITVPVGKISNTADKLLKVTQESLNLAIKQAVPGNRLSDISYAVQSYVEAQGFSVVRDFVGHGIGRDLHESPQIPNYGAPGRGVKLKAGMVLAIEPMINELRHEVKILEDGWTAITVDGGLSAHFEHTVAITSNGPEILTKI